jgi:superfamily II DNA/RNA helicase
VKRKGQKRELGVRKKSKKRKREKEKKRKREKEKKRKKEKKREKKRKKEKKREKKRKKEKKREKKRKNRKERKRGRGNETLALFKPICGQSSSGSCTGIGTGRHRSCYKSPSYTHGTAPYHGVPCWHEDRLASEPPSNPSTMQKYPKPCRHTCSHPTPAFHTCYTSCIAAH